MVVEPAAEEIGEDVLRIPDVEVDEKIVEVAALHTLARIVWIESLAASSRYLAVASN